MALVRIKKKNKTEETSADLIDLPEFPTVQKDFLSIENHLKSGSTIWAWYKINDFKIKDGRQLNISALENLSYRFDGLTALRKEGNYLIYYRVEIDRTFGIYLKPSKIYHFKNSSIAELYFDELDEHSNFFDACGQFTCSIKDTDIESYMSWHRDLTITADYLNAWQKQSQRFINPNALT